MEVAKLIICDADEMTHFCSSELNLEVISVETMADKGNLKPELL
jgi:hypothetical protein